jgi:type IV pilus biogenesis/stability protein PilW
MRNAATIAVTFALLLALGGCSSTPPGSRPMRRPGSESDLANPLYPFTLMRQGSVLLQQGRYDDALKSFEKAAQLQPENATTHNMVGLCYLKLEQYDKALAAFNKALDLVPSFSDARNNRGATYLALKQYRLAEVDFLAVLGDPTYPHRWDVYYNLGMTYFDRGQLGAAVENFRRAAYTTAPVFEAFLRLAEIAERQGKTDAAIDTLEQAHLKFPDQAEATFRLGKLLFDAGRKDEARKYLQEVADSDPSSKLADEARKLLEAH